MLYEIVNMSDHYTMRADDFAVAAVVCLMLGSGQYALTALEDGGEDVPMFMFGGHDEWFQEKFGTDIDTVIQQVTNEKRDAMIECFESVIIGDRREYEEAVKALADPKKSRSIGIPATIGFVPP